MGLLPNLQSGLTNAVSGLVVAPVREVDADICLCYTYTSTTRDYTRTRIITSTGDACVLPSIIFLNKINMSFVNRRNEGFDTNSHGLYRRKGLFWSKTRRTDLVLTLKCL